MSFHDLHSSPASNGRPPTEATDIELDVKLLGSFVAESEGIPADDSELSDSELLARLDSAHIMAGDVEAKLDEILDTLDQVLATLEVKDSDEPQEATVSRPESQSKRPPSEQS